MYKFIGRLIGACLTIALLCGSLWLALWTIRGLFSMRGTM